MKIFFFLFILFMQKALALEAVVTVLEAPMFRSKDINSPVVQYLRKGEVIKVHPSLANSDRYEHLAPEANKREALRKKFHESAQKDPLFKAEDFEPYSLENTFIPTIDRQGKEVYVLREHIYIYFETRKEFAQTISPRDPTDYRLQEPLPKNYPFKTISGYRGLLLVGFTQPYFESYPYLSRATTKGYTTPVDVNFTYLKQTSTDVQDRFYFGGTANIRFFQNNYTFENGSSADERGLKFGVGPYITYDAFKAEQNRLNLFGSINVYLWNQLTVSQQGPSASDKRTYRAYSVTPRVGVQYHRKGILEDLDLVLGTSIEIDPPTVFRATQGATQEGFWRNVGADRFTTQFAFHLAGFIGIQSAY